MIDKKVHAGECEYLTFCNLKKTAHVFTTHLESVTRNASDHIVVFALAIT